MKLLYGWIGILITFSLFSWVGCEKVVYISDILSLSQEDLRSLALPENLSHDELIAFLANTEKMNTVQQVKNKPIVAEYDNSIPLDVQVYNHPSDDGSSITISWNSLPKEIESYEIQQEQLIVEEMVERYNTCSDRLMAYLLLHPGLDAAIQEQYQKKSQEYKALSNYYSLTHTEAPIQFNYFYRIKAVKNKACLEKDFNTEATIEAEIQPDKSFASDYKKSFYQLAGQDRHGYEIEELASGQTSSVLVEVVRTEKVLVEATTKVEPTAAKVTLELTEDPAVAIVDEFTLPEGSPAVPDLDQPAKIEPPTYEDKIIVLAESEPQDATPSSEIIAMFKVNTMVIIFIICGVILLFIEIARRNPNLYIRKIAGLDAVDEAVGRATEMGKPIYFVHGIGFVGQIPTIAALSILGKIAEKIAEYNANLKVTNFDPLVMAISQETVKESYSKAGRPDAYKEENVFFVVQDQFAYAAAVDGIMVREKPGSIFFMGYFAAEALLLSETGSTTGAIQVAGTDSYTQLPFFITTCDYTLMGEELYAASAYLSREPRMLGSIRGMDVGKFILIAYITVGVILASISPELSTFREILFPIG